MINISNCPVCKSTDYKQVLKCKDHTVSGEYFNIQECSQCKFRFTSPVPEEGQIGKYYESEDYISHSNTSKDLISKIYKIARTNALKQKRELIQKRVKGSQWLDIGCGTGDFMRECESNGLSIKGIEPSEKARSFGEKEFGLEIYKEDQLKQWQEGSFDSISLWHVLEHVYPLNDRLLEIKRLLTPAGKAFIAVPNCGSADAKKYRDFWAAYDVPRHLYHFRKEQMIELCEKHDCVLEEILPMKLDAYYVSLLSEKYKGSGVMAYPKAFFAGLSSNLKARSNGEWSSLIYVISKK